MRDLPKDMASSSDIYNAQWLEGQIAHSVGSSSFIEQIVARSINQSQPLQPTLHTIQTPLTNGLPNQTIPIQIPITNALLTAPLTINSESDASDDEESQSSSYQEEIFEFDDLPGKSKQPAGEDS